MCGGREAIQYNAHVNVRWHLKALFLVYRVREAIQYNALVNVCSHVARGKITGLFCRISSLL